MDEMDNTSPRMVRANPAHPMKLRMAMMAIYVWNDDQLAGMAARSDSSR